MSDDDRPAYFLMSGTYGTKPEYEVQAGAIYTPREVGLSIEFDWHNGCGIAVRVLCWYVFVSRRPAMLGVGEGGRIL